MTSAAVRARLTHALRLDLIGPEPGEPQAAEILDRSPSRWYLTGFLAPWNAPASQKEDEEAQDELEGLVPGESGGDDDDEATREIQAARRGRFPSSVGLSILVPEDLTNLKVTARWGDYEPVEKDGLPTGDWLRTQREQTLEVRLEGEKAAVSPAPVRDGLELVTSVRRIRRPNELRGLSATTRAVSIFLVNRRNAIEGRDDLKDKAFVFQVSLAVEGDRPFVPRPNPRGGASDEVDERIADLQYRDAWEFAVGHGTSTRSIVSGDACSRVETTWMPQFEVERVEAASIPGVELSMQALADLPNASAA